MISLFRLHYLLYIIVLLFVASNAHSQGNNAVSITIMGSGQYSSVLSDFYDPSKAGMLTVVILNQDFKEAQIPVQLFMSVTHSFDKQPYITTKTPNPTQIINLKSNVPLTLTGKDLECIFNTAYLTYKGPNLKDGSNILKIYARDVRTGKVVSNTAQISLRSIMISPPRLTSPDNNIVLEHNYATQLFQWQPDNGGAYKPPQYNYRLRFCLWKLHGNDPYVEVLRKPDVDVVSIFSDKYEMILSTYHFEIGQRYCWRVKAEDPFEKMNIINDGWSDVRTFTYKHLPVPVTGVSHTVNLSNRKATVTWNTAEGHTKYYVETYNPQTDAHNTIETYDPKYPLMPAPDEEYKMLVRVKAQCWNDDSRQSSWTPWDTIHYPAYVKPESKYPCGYKFPKVEVTNLELKTDFKEGDIVSEANGSSDYEIINCRAAADGTLEGQFYLIMNAWGGAKIACEFWDTKINTDNIIITTRYESIDTPIGMVEPEALQQYVKSLWLDANSVATSSKIKDTIVIKEKFDYLYRNEDGEYMAVIVHPDGSTEETKANTFGSPNQCLVTDGQGDTVAIDRNGQVMGVKEYRATGGNKALLNEYHRKSDSLAQWQINFKPATDQTYAFDYLKSGNHGIFATDEYYPTSGKYDFRYKSIESSKTDRVVVDFGSYPDRDSVIFKDKYGVKLKVVDGNILTFTGVSKADTNHIYAYRGDQKIGKLFLNTYQKKTYKVVLVSVNKATLPDISTLETYLNKVYNQCAVKFEITTDKITLNDLTSFSHGGSGVFTVYNDDQKKVLSAYDKEMKDNTYYLFFVDNVTDKKDGNGTLVSGYMPRGYNAGFIYDGGSEHTIAHELGHGVAGLEHVFENSNNSGKTANLMDYASGEELWHFQWDQIQDPSRVWMKWNTAEGEGENRLDNQFYIQEKCKKIYFIFSPYFSKKFELLLRTDDNIIQTLDSWASGATTLNANQSKNVRNNIIKSAILDSRDYQTKIDYFKSLYTDNTPIVQIINNPDGTDSQHIAVYSLIGVATNISTLEDFNRSDISIQEPYFLSRYEVDITNNTLYTNTTGKDVFNEALAYSDEKSRGCGVFHLDITLTGEAGVAFVNMGESAEIGIGIDNQKNVALFVNAAKLYNFLNWGVEINLDNFNKSPSSIITNGKEKSFFSGYSDGVSASINFDWGYNDVRDLFGKSSCASVGFGFGELLFNCTESGKLIGAGMGLGLGYGGDISYWKIHSKGFIFTYSEFTLLRKICAKPQKLIFEHNRIMLSNIIINLIDKGDYWISKDALQLYNKKNY